MILAVYNSGVIPQVVFWTTEFMYFETISNKETRKMNMYFFYILINTIILPLTELGDISSVIEMFKEQSFDFIAENINIHLISKSSYFLRYLITATFITQAFILIDIPHWFSLVMQKMEERKLDKSVQKIALGAKKSWMNKDDEKKAFKDLFTFEISFNIAFNQVIYTMVFIYAVVSPFTLLIGALYFFVKYIVDKYLLCVIYPREYESFGEISANVLRLANISMILQ